MARRHEKTNTERIFENILFLEEVFGDEAECGHPGYTGSRIGKML